MKRIIPGLAALLISVLCAVSCTQALDSDAVDVLEPAVEQPELNSQEVILSAYIADSEPATKTTIIFDNGGDSGNWHGYWSAHEHISLFYGPGEGGGSDFTSVNTEPVDRTQFTGQIGVITGLVEGSDDIKFWGIYPYDERNTSGGSYVTTYIHDTQVAKPNTWADGESPLIGRSDGLAMGFYNLCGFFRFFLEPIDNDHIVKITFQSNDNRPLAGKVKVVMRNGKPVIDQFLDGRNVVSLIPSAAAGSGYFEETAVGSDHKVASGSSAVWYYMALPQNVWETTDGGITFTFYTANGMKGTRTFNSRQEITQSNYSGWSTALNRSDKVTFSQIPVENCQIRYTTTDNNPIEFLADGVHHTANNIIGNEWDRIEECFVMTFDSEITYLDDYAFGAKNTLKTITLPDGLQTIGKVAFMSCQNLTDVHIGSSTTCIRMLAFYNCPALVNVEMSEGLQYIANMSFTNCRSLESITLPSTFKGFYYDVDNQPVTVSHISNPLVGCTNLSAIHGSGPNFTTVDDKFLIFDDGKFLAATAPAAFDANADCIIPEGVETIGMSAMYGVNVSSIILPETATTVDKSGLAHTTANHVEIPAQVSNIGAYAFSESAIGHVQFKGDNLPVLGESAMGSGGENDLDFPIYITGYATIASNLALSNSDNLWYFYREACRIIVEQDKDEIWYHTTNNGTITFSTGPFGSNVHRVDGSSGVFYPVLYNPDQAGQPNHYICEAARGSLMCDFIPLTSDVAIAVQLFDGPVTSVPGAAFSNMTSIDYLSLPEGITSIASTAFRGCSSLQMFPMEYNCSSLTYVGAMAFSGCTQMRFPHSQYIDMRNLTSLDAIAFYGCESFGSDSDKSIIFLGQIGYLANTFVDCKKLTHILFFGPNGQATDDAVNVIKSVNGFQGCEKLVTINSYSIWNRTREDYINLPGVYMRADGNEGYVSKNAFQECKSIKEVRLGAAQLIDEKAFYECTALESVTLDGTQNLTTIGDYAFYKCTNLVKVGGANVQTGVVLPNVTAVGARAFTMCTHLSAVSLSNVTTLGDNTFGACSAIASAELPRVISLPNECFYNCSSLTSLSLPAVTSIGNYALRGTTSLTTLKLGSGLSTLGNYLFDGNTNGVIDVYLAGENPPALSDNTFTNFQFKKIHVLSNYVQNYNSWQSYGNVVGDWDGTF